MRNKPLKIFLIVLLVVCLVAGVCYIIHRHRTMNKSSETVLPEEQAEVPADSTSVALEDPVWMELPAPTDETEYRYVVTHRAQMEGRLQRNYTIL